MQLCDSHDEAAKHRQTDGLPVMSRYAIEQCSGGGSFWSSPPTCSRKRMGPSVPTQTHRPGGPRPQRLISVICVTDSDSDDFEKGFGGPGGRNTKICHVGRTDHRQPEAVGSGHVDEPRGPLRIEPRGLDVARGECLDRVRDSYCGHADRLTADERICTDGALWCTLDGPFCAEIGRGALSCTLQHPFLGLLI